MWGLRTDSSVQPDKGWSSIWLESVPNACRTSLALPFISFSSDVEDTHMYIHKGQEMYHKYTQLTCKWSSFTHNTHNDTVVVKHVHAKDMRLHSGTDPVIYHVYPHRQTDRAEPLALAAFSVRSIQMASVYDEQTLSLLMLRRPGTLVVVEVRLLMRSLQTCGLPVEANSHPQTGDVWYHRTACCMPHRGWRREKCVALINTYPRIRVIISFTYCKWLISSKQTCLPEHLWTLAASTARQLMCVIALQWWRTRKAALIHNSIQWLSRVATSSPKSPHSKSRKRGFPSLTSELFPSCST